MDLENLIRETITESIEKQLPVIVKHLSEGLTTTKPDQYLTRSEAAAYCRMSLPVLDKNTKSGALKPKLIGVKKLYSQAELDRFMNDRGEPSVSS